jgi:hypothetical protein
MYSYKIIKEFLIIKKIKIMNQKLSIIKYIGIINCYFKEECILSIKNNN